MSSSLVAIVLGLASAGSWGAGDFAGGLASKRAPLLGVLAIGQGTGVVLALAAAALLGEPLPGATTLAWSAAAGASGAVGLAALYRGLAVGRMAVVAPVSAVLSAAIPVVSSAVAEGMPRASTLGGFALALAGIWLVARAGPSDGGRRGVPLALVAGCGFGGFLVLLHRGAEAGTFWPLVAARATSLALSAGAAVVLRRPFAPPASALPLVLISGALDAAGNAFFVLAGHAGRLDIAAVLSSMYPASTVLLAAALLRERVSRPQAAGILAVLGAIALIAR